MDFKISDVEYNQVQHAPFDGKGASLQGGIAAPTFTCTCGYTWLWKDMDDQWRAARAAGITHANDDASEEAEAWNNT